MQESLDGRIKPRHVVGRKQERHAEHAPGPEPLIEEESIAAVERTIELLADENLVRHADALLAKRRAVWIILGQHLAELRHTAQRD